MLHRYISQFLEYCQLADFLVRSIRAITARLNEFEACLKYKRIRSVKKVTYRHLIDFVADYKAARAYYTGFSWHRISIT